MSNIDIEEILNSYNLISLGDHCAIPIVLKELNLKKHTYPFDWISLYEQLNDSNIMINFNIMKELLSNSDIETNILDNIVNKYIGNALLHEDKINKDNNIWFPHEKWYSTINEYKIDAFEKYKRRFLRLHNDIRKNKTIFFILTRHFYINIEQFNEIYNFIININPNNKIIFISGKNHEFIDNNYKKCIFKYIPYDITKFYDYDYTDFRPQIKDFIQNYFYK